MDEEHFSPDIDHLRFCEGCDEWRHKNYFDPGRTYCKMCHKAHLDRMTHALRMGTLSSAEIANLSSFELPRPITPEDRVTYTIADDEPPLTTDELNAIFMERPPTTAEWRD